MVSPQHLVLVTRYTDPSTTFLRHDPMAAKERKCCRSRISRVAAGLWCEGSVTQPTSSMVIDQHGTEPTNPGDTQGGGKATNSWSCEISLTIPNHHDVGTTMMTSTKTSDVWTANDDRENPRRTPKKWSEKWQSTRARMRFTTSGSHHKIPWPQSSPSVIFRVRTNHQPFITSTSSMKHLSPSAPSVWVPRPLNIL